MGQGNTIERYRLSLKIIAAFLAVLCFIFLPFTTEANNLIQEWKIAKEQIFPEMAKGAVNMTNDLYLAIGQRAQEILHICQDGIGGMTEIGRSDDIILSSPRNKAGVAEIFNNIGCFFGFGLCQNRTNIESEIKFRVPVKLEEEQPREEEQQMVSGRGNDKEEEKQSEDDLGNNFQRPIRIINEINNPIREIKTIYTINNNTSVITIDKEIKDKVDLLYRQLNSDRDNYSADHSHSLPDNIGAETFSLDSGDFEVNEDGNITAQDIAVNGSLTAGSLFATNLTTGDILFDNSTISTNANLILGPEGDIQFYNQDNAIDSSGNLILAGNISLAQDVVPTVTSDKLYNLGGNLYWNGVNITGSDSLPAAVSGQTLYHNGSDWTADSNLFNNGTNVGIGTTNPVQKLEVNGIAQIDTALITSKIYPAVNSTAAFQFNKADGVTNVMNVDTTNSRVGIGTTSPAQELEVSGIAQIDTALIIPKIYPSANSTTAVQFNKADGTTNIVNIDTANNRVGIGTTAPKTSFHIYNGTGSGTANYNSSIDAIIEDDANAYLGFNGSGYAGIAFNDDNNSIRAGMFFNYSTDQIAFSAGTTENRLVIAENGNVGVGTTAPTAVFHIKAGTAAASTAPLKFTSGINLDTPESGALEFDGTSLYFTPSDTRKTLAFLESPTLTTPTIASLIGSKIYPATNSTTALQFNKADGITNVMNIDTTNGMIGVGITAPLAKLHIGNLEVNNSVDSQVLISRNVDDTISGNGHAFSDSSNIDRSGTIGYNSFDARINYSGSNSYDHYAAFQAAPVYGSSGTLASYYGLSSALAVNAGTVTQSIGVYLQNPSGAGNVVDNYGLYVASLTKGTSKNYAIYTAGTTASYFGGNIGINNTIPGTKLDVVKSDAKGDVAYFTNSFAGTYTEGLPNGSLRFYSRYAGQSSNWETVRLKWGYVDTYGNNGSRLGIDLLNSAGTYSNVMTFTGNGSVGIGTTAPSYALDVAGSIRTKGGYFYATQSSSSNTFAFDATSSTIHKIYNNSTVPISIGTNSNVSQLYLQSGGNVGIGTTNPGAKLDVNGTGWIDNVYAKNPGGMMAASKYNLYGGSDSSDLALFADSGWTALEAITNGKGITFKNYDDNTYLMTVIDSGNVGIGTTAPAAGLDVQKTMTAASGVARGTNLAQALTAAANNDVLTALIIAPTFTNGDYTGVKNYGLLVESGNVGIGTTSPAYLLAMGTGGGYYNESTGAWTNGSDRNYKDSIVDLSKYGLDTINDLRPVSYVVKSSGVEQVGFIAQEVKEIIPELVSGQDGSMGLNYGGFAPVLVKAIQDQQREIDDLKLTLTPQGAISNASSTLVMTQGDGLFGWLVGSLNSLGVALKDGVASLAEVAADTITSKLVNTDEVNTKRMCITGDDGNSVCLTKEQLEALIEEAGTPSIKVKSCNSGADMGEADKQNDMNVEDGNEGIGGNSGGEEIQDYSAEDEGASTSTEEII